MTIKSITNETLLFVYGSLMRGMRAHHLLKKARFVDRVQTTPQYQLLVYETYPGLVAGHLSIEGELFAVSEGCLAALDEYEGVPDDYIRTNVELSNQPTSLKYEAYFLHPALIEDATLYPARRWEEG